MVTAQTALVGLMGVVAVSEPAAPVLEQLDPPRRAAVVMALLGLVLTGLVLITCVMLGAHWVRRLARHKPADRQGDPGANHVAENRRLRSALDGLLSAYKTGDTIHMDGSSKETKVDPP